MGIAPADLPGGGLSETHVAEAFAYVHAKKASVHADGACCFYQLWLPQQIVKTPTEGAALHVSHTLH